MSLPVVNNKRIGSIKIKKILIIQKNVIGWTHDEIFFKSIWILIMNKYVFNTNSG